MDAHQILEEFADCMKDQEAIESTFDKLVKEKRADLYRSETDLKKKTDKQKKRIKSCLAMLNALEQSHASSSSSSDNGAIDDHENFRQLAEKKAQLKHSAKKLEMIGKQTLNTGGFFVEQFLGKEYSVVLVGDDSRKFNFKKEYETFKYKCTVLNIPITLLLAFFFHSRVLDTFYHLYLTYFYLTLAIRENILAVNGSNIKAWWIRHHYLSIVLVITLLTWPETVLYQAFRPYFLLYALYASIVQVLQYKYQKDRLYVRTAIGKSSMMDVANSDSSQVVVETSLALFFLLPFIFLGQLFQFYNAYLLLDMGYFSAPNWRDVEWQVFANAALFLILAAGNLVTTIEVLMKKWKRIKKKELKQQ
ncbi:hypothetical protein FDP41_008494 [Naegleria fowleri]|uniref:Uncharacterized protein n=1 Tax=Naegleria fowleri TaxID=5763 RepID=A0A6A5B6N5_NAEFO|nr:uncharacterized protein FDP41_008494 [Naegleria fowleri]KAF0973287.1 hypothetical protein FDP41_008494 [Naegleria fowleri]CAG4708796.1 unnamed protein product [Naegleria fowleri]